MKFLLSRFPFLSRKCVVDIKCFHIFLQDNSSSRADTLASERQKRVFLQGIQGEMQGLLKIGDLFESQRSHQRKNDRTFLFLGIKDLLQDLFQDLFQGERERLFIDESQNSFPTIMIGDGSQNSFQTIMLGDEMQWPNPFSLMGRTSVSRSSATRLVSLIFTIFKIERHQYSFLSVGQSCQ